MTVKFSAFTTQTGIGDTDQVVGLHGAVNSIWTGAVLKFYTSASPTLVTPVLGVATATTINKVTITQPASAATLTIVDGKTLTVSKILTLTGTDSTTMTFPTTSATIARTDSAQTFTGVQTFTAPILGTPVLRPGASVTPASNGDMVFEATSDTTVTLKLKGSDGTVRSAIITLS